MDTCLAIEQYRQKLIEITNNSSLTIGAALYILKDFIHVVEADYMQALRREMMSPQEETQTIEFDSEGFHNVTSEE